MRSRILALAFLQAGAGLLVVMAIPAGAPGRTAPAEVAGFAVAFALAGLLPVHLEFRRGSFAVVLDEAVWVMALFALSPAGVVAAAVAGESLAKMFARQSPLKTAYNLGSTFFASAAGVWVFALLGPGHAGDPAAWLAALAAMVTLSGASLLSISVVLSLVEGRRLRAVLVDSAGSQILATAANASIGLAAVVLLHASALGPLMLAPILAAVVLASRRHTVGAAEHLRFERLYEAAGRTGGLAGFDEALLTLAGEARALLTGSAAVCGAARGSGGWSGAQVDDAGSGPAEAATLAALAGLARPGEARTLALAELPREVRDSLPPGMEVVVAAPAPPAKTGVVLAVFREIAPDGQHDGRQAVLAAFAGHAALVMANAVLFEEVDAALHREIALGQQKSEFVAAVSHELRTPLTTVIGAVATIQRLGDRLDQPTQDQLLTRALDQGARLRRLIDELLLVAAAEHSGLQADIAAVDVAHVVKDVVGGLSDRSGGRIRVELASGTGRVHSDEDKVRRIVSNLVENALKYAPEGPITIDTGRTAAGVAVSVSDEGPGISPLDRPRVFEPFVQLDQSSTRRQGGTGLGLHLCRQLADLLGGSLDLDEAPGGGCRFTLHLPDPATRPTRSEVAAPLPVPSTKPEGALV